jgi:adenylate cyclase
MSVCPSCQAENPAGARFCNQCGTRLADAPSKAPTAPKPPAIAGYAPRHLVERVLRDRAAMQGERKRVTVLFADIKGSTALAAQAGAEAWHDILDRFFTLLTRAVHRYEGTVNQYTGDGIMALFGAPLAHEDHAFRAGLAALEMQAEVRRFADELRLERGLNLSMRIGMNTGEVIVGRIGDDLRMDYTAQGLTTNLAARMEQICEPGRVLLTRDTAALVEGYLDLRSLGEMAVNGLERPLEVFELLGRGRHVSRLERSLSRGGSRFVGRDHELAVLHRALEQSVGGQGRIVAVSGDAGMGKSRLCHEFGAACTERGIAVHRAAGLSYGQQMPMLPVQAWLRSRLGLAPRAAFAEVRRRVSEAFAKEMQTPAPPGAVAFVFDFLGVSEPGEISSERVLSLRKPMMAGLAHFLPCADEAQVLLLEDLHFVDAETLEFLPSLFAELRRHRTLLLINYRAEYADEWLRPHIDEKLMLPALPEEQIARLTDEWLGADAALAGTAEAIRRRSGGNPFFVEEAVSTLVEAGYLGGMRGDYRPLRPLDQWPIPHTVHALIATRIDRLPADRKAVLHAAAVIGAEFRASLLASVVDVTAPLKDLLCALEDAGFLALCNGEEDRYRFTQPLIQEIAHDTQLQGVREQLHVRIARALQNGASTAVAASEIAHHWSAAGDWEAAGQWNLQAARWATGRDLRQSVEQYRLAVRHLDRAASSPAVLRMRIAARAGLIRLAPFWPVEAELIDRLYEEAREWVASLGDIEGSAELLISYANELLHRGASDKAAEHARRAVELCIEHRMPEVAGRFRLSILLTHSAIGRTQEGVDLANRAGGAEWLTRPIDEENYLSRGFNALRLAWNGELARAASDLEAATAFADREGRPNSWLHANRVDLAWIQGCAPGQREALIAIARRAVEQSDLIGSVYFRAIALRALGQALSMNDRHEDALVPLREGRPFVAKGAAAYQFEANYLAVMAEALIGAGCLVEALEVARTAVESGRRSGSRLWELRACVAAVQLPPAALPAAEFAELATRAQALIDFTGALGLLPQLVEARARHAADPAISAQLLAEAAQRYERIGAHAHAARLRTETSVANPVK